MDVALVGIGKIAVDQHVPAITASADWDLAATVSRNGSIPGIQAFADIDRLLRERPDIRVISLCLPPGPRFEYAKKALLAGRHVMLEKPPGATLAEVHELEAIADRARLTLFASWHSREAAAVAAAKAWLGGKTVTGGKITWREDVRKWHPGQDWVFEAAGMGVFDPGINALSILTEILPAPMHLTSAELDFPENCATPIAARLSFTGGIVADFDWRQEGPQTWDIEIMTTQGQMALRAGGNRLEIDGRHHSSNDKTVDEYSALYARLAELIQNGKSDVDLSPMIHVADAFTLGRRNSVAAFYF